MYLPVGKRVESGFDDKHGDTNEKVVTENSRGRRTTATGRAYILTCGGGKRLLWITR